MFVNSKRIIGVVALVMIGAAVVSPRDTAPKTTPPSVITPSVATPPPAEPLAQWEAFAAHVSRESGTGRGSLNAITSAANAQDTTALYLAAADLESWADGELQWLADNPPAPCYAVVHRAWRGAVQGLGGAGDAAQAWMVDIENQTLADSAITRMTLAGKSLTSASSTIDSASC